MIKKSMHVEGAFKTALQQINLAFARLESAEDYLEDIPGTESLLKDIVSAQETVDWLHGRAKRHFDAMADKLLVAYYEDHQELPRDARVPTQPGRTPGPHGSMYPICKCQLCEMYRAYYGED